MSKTSKSKISSAPTAKGGPPGGEGGAPAPMKVPQVPPEMARPAQRGPVSGVMPITPDDLMRTIGEQQMEIRILRRRAAELEVAVRDGLDQTAELTIKLAAAEEALSEKG